MFKDKRGYIYQKKRVDGRVVTSYIGSGKTGSAGDRLLQRERKQKAKERNQRQKEQLICSSISHELYGAHTDMAVLHLSCERLVEIALVQAGYHKHARGEWRKKRAQRTSPADPVTSTPGTSTKHTLTDGGNMQRTKSTKRALPITKEEESNGNERSIDIAERAPNAVLATSKANDSSQIEEKGSHSGKTKEIERPEEAPKIQLTRQQFRDLEEKAHHDESAAAEIVAYLKQAGHLDLYMDMTRDAASTARRSLIDLFSSDKVQAHIMELRLDAMQEELAGPGASALEKQLAERIALCSLEVNYFQALFAQNASDGTASTLYQNRLDAAHKRHLSAIKALAQVRKLQIPVLQFNLAEQQVNIGHLENTGSRD